MSGVIDGIYCCGDPMKDVELTPEENSKHNCGRGCCADAYQCSKCNTRIVISFEAPEVRWD